MKRFPEELDNLHNNIVKNSRIFGYEKNHQKQMLSFSLSCEKHSHEWPFLLKGPTLQLIMSPRANSKHNEKNIYFHA